MQPSIIAACVAAGGGKKRKKTMDLRLKIATSPMGGYQWLIVILCFLLNLLDGFDVLALAFTAASIREEFGLSGAQIGTLMSAGLFGMSAGSLLLAPQADRFGRRPLLIVSTALSARCWAAFRRCFCRNSTAGGRCL